MQRPFFGANPIHLEMDVSVIASFVMPVVMKALLDLSSKLVERHTQVHQPKLPRTKLLKVAMHLTKACIYMISWWWVLPLFVSLTVKQYNSSPPKPIDLPFSNGLDNFRYFKLNVTMLVGLYVMEMITVSELDWPTWLHHCAILCGGCLFSGAIPWANANDMAIFVGSAVIGLFCQCLNCMGHVAFAWYHISKDVQVQRRLIRFNRAHLIIVCLTMRPILAWTWIALKWHRYQSLAPIVVTFFLDASILYDNIFVLRCLNGMCKKCSLKLEGSAIVQQQKSIQSA